MSNKVDYEAVLEQAKALEAEKIKSPYMPVNIYTQEAEDLVVWSLKDREALQGAGTPETHFDNINHLAGALRYSQSLWMEDLKSRQDAEQQWAEQYPEALDFSNQLIHTFRYAYRFNDDILENISAIAEGSGAADTIQDLSDLAILGQKNPEPLASINFDTLKLEKAETLSAHLGDLRAMANGEKYEANESLTIRNQMYSLLKQYVDDVRACGKYLFWRNKDRLRGYKSNYNSRRS